MQQNKIKTVPKVSYHQQSSLQEIIKGCSANNRIAQKVLYKRFYGKLFGTAIRYTRNKEEAQEVLNNAFLKIFASIDSYRPTGSFPAWVNKIVIYTSIDYLRKYTKFKDTAPIEYANTVTLPNHIIAQMSAEEIYQLLNKLSPTTKAVFSMYALDGFKHREVADILDISENTSKWYFAKAKKELQILILNQQ